MSILKHFVIVLLPAVGMTTWLYAYKPRHYAIGKLIVVFAINLCLWLAIFGALYAIVMAIVEVVKRYFLK